MAKPTTNEYGDLVFGREAYLRPQWLKALLSGKLGAGDTFWVGNVGIALIYMPALIFFAIFLPLIAGATAGAGAADVTSHWVSIAGRFILFCYLITLAFALFKSTRRRTDLGVLGWLGVALTLLHAWGAWYI